MAIVNTPQHPFGRPRVMDFADALRALMAERGIGVRALARRVPCDPGLISKLANGHQPPSRQMAGRIDDLLGGGGGLAALATRQRGWQTTGGSAVAAEAPRHVAPELIDYFHAQLAGHYSADKYLGPLHLLPTALAQHQLVTRLADAAAGGLRRDFWRLGAAYSALVGWLYQDAGDLKRSAYWHDVMLELAHRSADVQLIGFALASKAMLRIDLGDGSGAVDLADAALTQWQRLCPKVRVLALERAAHGLALGGDQDGCERQLDEAADLVARVDDQFVWGNACRGPKYVDVQRATCRGRLGDCHGALEIWADVIDAVPDSARRDIGVFRARQGAALAASGEPEEAVRVASKVIPLLVETGSARMGSELEKLRDAMNPWREEPVGRELDEMLNNAARPGLGRQS